MSHPIVERLASVDPEERRAACLEAAGDPAAALLIDALVGALGDPDWSVVRAASDALAEIGRTAPEADATVRRALASDHAPTRWGAAITSARLAPPGPRLLPPLAEALAAPDGHVRWAATRTLVQTGRTNGEVLPLLLGLARASESRIVRRMAIHGLRALAPEEPAAARALVEATRDGDIRVRRASLAALAAVLDPAPFVVARLAEVLDGETDPPSRRIAAVALGELGAATPGALPESAVSLLERVRESADDPDLRRGAERALRRIASA